MMYLADSAQLQELRLKGSPSGKNYIGPPGPAGGPPDREIVSFDGRSIVMRWINPEVANRYGMGVYVRCGAGRRGPLKTGACRPLRRDGQADLTSPPANIKSTSLCETWPPSSASRGPCMGGALSRASSSSARAI